MNVFAYGYWYVCDPILRPVVDRLQVMGHRVTYYDEWRGDFNHGAWQNWLDNENRDRVFLLVCDNLTGTHRPGIERIEECRQRGIPTVGIQHGSYSVKVTTHADYTCLWGSYYSRWITANRYRYTGNPAFDHPPDKQKARKAVGMDRYALFAGSFRNQYSSKSLLVKVLQETAEYLPVVVRGHPNPEERAFDDTLRKLATENQNIILWEGDRPDCGLDELVAGAQLIVGRSTVLVQGACWGIPALVASEQDDPRADGLIYHQYQGYPSIEEALAGRPSRWFVQRHTMDIGGSAGRVIDVLKEAVGERKHATLHV
jgi:hypothetical protein